MKKIILVAAAVSSMIAFNSFADLAIGVVDVQQVLTNSSQAKSLRDKLKTQFTKQHNAIDAQGKQLQADMAQYQKNQAVMSKADLDALRSKINNEQQTLGQMQGQFQQGYMQARDQAMEQIFDSVKVAAGKVAAQKNLDLVVAKQSIIYAKGGSDITSDVISAMK